MSDDEMTALIEEQGNVQERIDQLNGWEIEREIEEMMRSLNCPPKDADVTKLSGGERRRIALCRLLMEKPDMLSS
jgi:energy-dependent translational throttle protein EttA